MEADSTENSAFSCSSAIMATRASTVNRLVCLTEDKHVLAQRVSSLSDAEHQAIASVLTKLENVDVSGGKLVTSTPKPYGKTEPEQTSFSSTPSYNSSPYTATLYQNKGPAPFVKNISPRGFQPVQAPKPFQPHRNTATPSPPPLEPVKHKSQQSSALPPPPLGPVSPPSESHIILPPPPDPEPQFPSYTDLPADFPPPPEPDSSDLPPPLPASSPPSISQSGINVDIPPLELDDDKTNKLMPKTEKGQYQHTKSAGHTPICTITGRPLTGPYILAGDKYFAPEIFVCATRGCDKKLLDTGYIEDNGKLRCPDCYYNFVAPTICGKCNKPCRQDVLMAIGQHFHPTCFVCSHCGQMFGGKTFHMENGKPYCEKDWLDMFAPKCASCEKYIAAGERWFESGDKSYHVGCFRCAVCQRTLENQKFYMKQNRLLCYAHASGH